MKTLQVCSLLLLFYGPACALRLPTGDEVAIANVEEKNGKIVSATLLEPNLITTPLGAYNFSSTVPISFHENGAFNTGWLYNRQKVNTPIGAFEFTMISFYDNGKFQTGYLVSKQILNTPAGKVSIRGFDLYPGGEFKTCYLAEPQIVDSSLGRIKVDVLHFHQNGNIESVKVLEPLSVETSIGKIIIAKGYAFFHENGKIKTATLAKSRMFDTSLGKLKGAQGGTIWMNPDGGLGGLTLVDTQQIQTSVGKYKFDSVIFDEKGQLHYAQLKEDVIIKNTKFHSKAILKWDETGNFIGEEK